MDSQAYIKVLLIEDNQGDVRLIQEMLLDPASREPGFPDFDLVDFDKLAKSLIYLDENSVDLILLDLQLPDCAGLETFSRTQQRAPNTPVIILTGMSDDRLGRSAVQAGAQDYLIKGKMDESLLRRAIWYAIERQELRLQLQQKADDLTASEVRLRTLIENNADGILVIDDQGIVRFSNPAAEALFGCSSAELLGSNFGFLLADTTATEIEIANQQTNRALAVEMRVVSTVWEGDPCVMATLRDVTERRQAELALKESEARFRSLVENLPDVIFRYDENLRHIYASPNVVSILSRKAGDYLGKTHRELDYPDHDAQFWEERIQMVLDTGQMIEEEIFRSDSGRSQYLNWRLAPEFNSNGQAKSVLGIMRDITQRIEAEEATITERNLLRTVIDNLPDLVYVKDIHQKYLTVNLAAMKHMQANSLIDVVGKTDFAIYPPDFATRTQDIETLTLSTGQAVINQELHFFDPKTNVKQWLLCTTAPLRDRDGQITGLVGIRRDVTENRKAEEALKKEHALLAQRVNERTVELRQANKRLTQALRVKDEFLASMSHELRTPLNAILGMAEVLQEKIYGDLNEQQLKSAGIIAESGRHLLALINDILDVARIEADKLQLNKTPILVTDICETSIRLVQQAARKKNLKISITYSELGMMVLADERRLKQILVNLLSNAVKFTPNGGAIGLEVNGDAAKKVIEFRVWDTGIGIAQENIEKLFQPFVQLDSCLSREYEGTGLGLALVRLLADLHGATVSVESELDKGSCFTLLMAWSGEVVAPPADGRKAEEFVMPEISARTYGLTQPLILLAEDNVANVEVMTNYLLAKGYRVEVAYDGAQAIEQTKKLSPDLILMDIQMPEVDGLEATRRIRDDATLPAVPIIALTALAMPGDKERCLAAGANDYLSKPVSLRGLTEAIEMQLERWRRQN